MNGLIAEALRCREALVWIQRNGLQTVTIESDSLVLASQINKGSIYNSSVWLIIDGCRSLIRSLSDCDIVHVRRLVSHCLAKASVFGSKMGEWRCSPPFLNYVHGLRFDYIKSIGYYQKKKKTMTLLISAIKIKKHVPNNDVFRKISWHVLSQ